jgi:hypothetical protein
MCFIFGFFNASHMLSFSSAADVVRPEQIGTSAAIVNGLMFIAGGLFISAPGARIVDAKAARLTGLAGARRSSRLRLASLDHLGRICRLLFQFSDRLRHRKFERAEGP